jgi:DNA replication protein DnaC
MVLHPAVAAHYEKLRRENGLEYEKRLNDCRIFAPQIVQIEKALRGLIAEVAQEHLTVNEAKERQMLLHEEQQELLLKKGFPMDYLEPIVHCPYCGDTGFVGDPVKKPCSCHLLLLQQFLADGAKINCVESFENFDEEIYPTEHQKKEARKALAVCKQYADTLPKPYPANLLILGQAGLGKSYFGNAIAYRAIENGVHSLRTTAYSFINDIVSGFSEHNTRLFSYIEPDFLVLDDLGSEPMIPNVTVESVFTLINERMLSGKASCVISNFSVAELHGLYGERVASRFVDTEAFRLFKLNGANLRYKKGGA